MHPSQKLNINLEVDKNWYSEIRFQLGFEQFQVKFFFVLQQSWSCRVKKGHLCHIRDARAAMAVRVVNLADCRPAIRL